MSIIVNLDVMLAKRKMTSLELSQRIGLTPANLSILKTGKAKAIRFSTLEAICRELKCQPGEILEFVDDEEEILEADALCGDGPPAGGLFCRGCRDQRLAQI